MNILFCVKFGVQIDIGHISSPVPKITLLTKFKMAAAAILDLVFDLASVANESISVKFGAHAKMILPYDGAGKITFFAKLKLLSICTKFDTPIQNEMLMAIRK